MRSICSTVLPATWRFLAVAWCASALLWAGLLAVRPDVHEHVHEDAHEAAHTCAVELYAQGLPLALDFVAVASPEWTRVERIRVARETGLLAREDTRQPPGRAPPVG